MTVSRVLNGKPGVSEKKRQFILETVETLGYVANAAARTLRGTSQILGLVVPGIGSPYMGQVIRGIMKTAERLDYGVMLYTQGDKGAELSHTEGNSRIDYFSPLFSSSLTEGAVLVVPYDYETLVDAFKEHQVPYVIIDHHGNIEDEPVITATNQKGIIDAMRHLLALGHKRIGFITGRMNMGCAQDRLLGYQTALKEVGLPYEQELVREGDFEQPTGFAKAVELLQLNPRPTAIIASNDVMAFGAMDAIKDIGLRVGHDVSVIGFDDIPMASQVYPTLTTVRQPMAEMGEAAVDLLITLLRGHTPLTLQRELSTELIIRESTARPPQK
ncbi:MAG: LacI family DNA-binding transcriptional regulator [Anaerolineae bacterium]|nr:LacI family DNA-binding transcriptional regulator [Anaerolineae bacterium]